MTRPQTIPHTKRQTVQNAAGQALERSYLYLLPSTWTALKALCAASGSPTSELIEQLILTAASGTHKDIANDSNASPRHRNN
jgi:hypothetical protein